MSVVVNEFEVVTAPTAGVGPGGQAPGQPTQQAGGGAPAGPAPSPWAALETATAQRRLAERAARLEAH